MKFLSPNKYAARLCLFLAMVYFTSYITRLNYNAAMAAIIEEGTLSKPQAGVIGSALFFTYGFGQLISGALGDRFKPNHIMAVGLGLTACCNIMMPLVSASSLLMTVVWGVNGFAQALMWPPIVKLMASYLNEGEYAKCNWLVSTAAHSATILIYIAVPACITWLNWRAAFVLSAVLAALCMVAWLCGFRGLSGKLTDHYADIPAAQNRKAAVQGSATRMPLGRAFVVSGAALILVAIAMQGFLKDGVQSWMPTFFTEVFQMASSTAILSNMLLPIFNIVVVTVATWLYQRVFRHEVREAMTFFALSIVLSALLACFYQSSAVLCLLLAAIITGSMHGINLMFISFLPRRFAATGKVATVSGICNSCSYVGSCISSYGIALVAEKLGWQITLFSWAGVALIGVVICVIVHRKWSRFIAPVVE